MKRILMMFMLPFCFILCYVVIAPASKVYAGTQATYYASPTGSGSTCSLAAPCSLTGAQTKVRTINSAMTGDIIVVLRGGTYALTSTFALTDLDSGSNGWRVIYQNYTGETPIISGGTDITGWTLVDAGKNIYRASVASTLETRQIYVNATRAVRAKADYGTAEYTGLGISAQSDGTGIVPGWTTSNTSLQSWGNKSDLEFVFRVSWEQHRVGVSTISGSTITMKSALNTIQNSGALKIKNVPDYANARNVPDTVENAYELLDTEGEWYLNRTTDYMYYKPRTGEDMATASVITAELETLVSGTGTLSAPIHHITFQGLSFMYATWLEPNGNNGYVDIQANFTAVPGATLLYAWDMDNWVKTPANLTFSTAKSIRFERNKFMHLGGVGLGFESGSQDNVISGNEFTDISGTAVQIGGGTANDHHPSDIRSIVKNNDVTNNYIHNIAVEYRDGVGIFAGYTEDTLIANNEMTDLPYSAISLGWGWGSTDWDENPFYAQTIGDASLSGRSSPTTSKDNKIISNHIYDVMKYLKDGGGIYLLAAQPGLIVSGNVVHDLPNAHAAIYFDNGSRYATATDNITYANPHNYLVNDYDLREWNHDFEFNYWDVDGGSLGQTNSISQYNGAIANGIVPAAILDNAGIQTAYLDILPKPSVNLAIGKTATAYYNDGSIATMNTGGEADKAVDGNPTTRAQATGQYAWTEQVDLGNVYTVDRVVINFPMNPPYVQNLFATDYEIQVSLTGVSGSFTTVKSITGGSGGISEQSFTPVNIRFVRVKALKPDGAGQTGNQMGISELQIYGKLTFTPVVLPHLTPVVSPDKNVAQGKKATGFYNDGSLATMHIANGAELALDNDPNTKAQATGQYAWTEQVDLGEVYNINHVKISFGTNPPFPENLYATEFEIQASLTGANGSFTVVKSVIGFTGGVSDQIFNPISARYIRIKALKPNGVGQTGNQMAIAELEVYEYKNLAYKKAAAAYYNDGSAATMLPSSDAANAVDGNTATKAQATNQFAWTQEVDLGAIYPVNHVNVMFNVNDWATDFEIQVSSTGGNGNFTTVKTVTGFLGDSLRKVYSSDFTQVNARYIRIKALKPDASGQTGGQMAITELQVYGIRTAIKLSEVTDSSSGPDKSLYLNISTQPFTFQTGDIIAYDVKLLTNSINMGGIDIVNSDSTRFRNQTWSDQNAITGNPVVDLTSKANGRWYHRELVVPTAMVGKTAAKWLLAAENDSVSAHQQAEYANLIVIRSGVTQLVVYGNGSPSSHAVDSYANYVYTPYFIYDVVGRH